MVQTVVQLTVGCLLIGAFSLATPAQRVAQGRMNKPRTEVEHLFTKMSAVAQIMTNKRGLKIFEGPPLGPMMACIAFFTNCHTCLEGSQTCIYFGSSPPSLEE